MTMLQTDTKWADFDDTDDLYGERDTRKKKWEDLDAEEETIGANKLSQFTNYKDGIKVITKYSENMNKQTVKITKQIREIIVKRRVSKEVEKRQKFTKFNVANLTSVTVEPTDNVNIEVPKANPMDFLKGAEYDYLFVDSANKSAKDLKNKFKILKDEEPEEVKLEDPSKAVTRRDGTYYRSNESQHRECTVRVTNLSEDVNENDLSNLFGRVGNIVRMYLAKHKETQNSKGFAFITYSKREEARRAIEKLNRHGFENLLLSVEWAKPSNR